MKIVHSKNINFSIGSDGGITRTGTWRVKPEEEVNIQENRSGFRQEVEDWAGKVGDPFRLPTADLQGYIEDIDYIVAEISFSSVEFSIYDVTFTGCKKHLTAAMTGGILETVNEFGEREKSAGWRIHADSMEDWLPKIGDALSWAGADCQCVNISSRQLACREWEVKLTARDTSVLMIGNPSFKHNNNLESFSSAKWRVSKDAIEAFLVAHAVNTAAEWAGDNYVVTAISSEANGASGYYVTLEARDMSVLMIGNPSFKHNNSLESFSSAKWRVGKNAIEDFLATHEINNDASGWAGEGYYVTEISSQPDGMQGYLVTIEARHVGIRKIDVKRRETFAGYDIFGNLKREIVWTGRWRVHRDNKQDFENITGFSAADWAEEGYIVTSVDPSRISDMEYEYTVEAKSPENSNLALMHYKNDRTNLASRIDVMVDSGTFILSAEQCGWIKNDEGKYDEIEDWLFGASCPFQTEDMLEKEMIGSELLCAVLTVSTYRRGETRRHVTAEVQWANSSRIVSNADGHEGDWRKIEIKADIINDSRGDVWTKVSKKYMHAPASFKWNPNFWK
jgi:hypothetical protein